ncbi:MAG TPA: hypothetical protein VFL13_05665 [Candidatus Baltobacteraceae bacterium]|nr:hypothetical protein [Candidatus Baltobacteraceae bacterium]
MNVAISGDRSSCLALEPAPGSSIVALARGFGSVQGEPVTRIVLNGLRGELARKLRGERLARACRKPRGVVRVLTGAFGHVNAEVFARSAGNEDYVTAGCSLTALVLANGSGYLAHTGSTAAYLIRDGNTIALTQDDAIETPAGRVLTRAVGCSPALQVAVSSFDVQDGDELVLGARAGERTVVVRYAAEPAAPDLEGSAAARVSRTVALTMFFLLLLCLQ